MSTHAENAARETSAGPESLEVQQPEPSQNEHKTNTQADVNPNGNDTASSVSRLLYSRRGTSSQARSDDPSTSVPLWDKLDDADRAWVTRHPTAWRTPDSTPPPPPETGQPHHCFSFGSDQDLYGVADGDVDAEAYTAAEIESYTPGRAPDLTEQLKTVQRVARTPTGDAAAAKCEEMRPMLRRAAARRAFRDPVGKAVEQRLAGINLVERLGRPPQQPPREPMGWRTFLGGRTAHERFSPQTAHSRQVYEHAEEERQRAEKAEAMRRSPLKSSQQTADLLGITCSAVRQWARRHHIPVTKIAHANHYRLADIMRYAAQFMEQPADAAA